MSEVIIGVDLGGTKIRAARLDAKLNILERQETLTRDEEGLEPTLVRIKAMIEAVWPQDGTKVTGIGICAPGPLDPETGVVVAPPNLYGWHNVPLGDILHEAFNVPIYVGNDANVAALAETTRGAAQGFRHVIFITISTGIGSGIVVDGRLLLGKSGLAAEFGHVPIIADGVVSSVEREGSGTHLARKMRERLEAGATSLVSQLVNGDLEKVDAKTIGQAVAQGDKLAVEVVREGAYRVGLGVVGLLHLFNPEIIVIGGGVSNMGDVIFEPIWEAVKAHTLDEAYWQDLKIVPAALQDDVSIVGAAALVLTHGGQSDISLIESSLTVSS